MNGFQGRTGRLLPLGHLKEAGANWGELVEPAVDVGGLAVLGYPSYRELRGKPLNKKTADKVELAGLASLAALNIPHLRKAIFKAKPSRMAKVGGEMGREIEAAEMVAAAQYVGHGMAKQAGLSAAFNTRVGKLLRPVDRAFGTAAGAVKRAPGRAMGSVGRGAGKLVPSGVRQGASATGAWAKKWVPGAQAASDIGWAGKTTAKAVGGVAPVAAKVLPAVGLIGATKALGNAPNTMGEWAQKTKRPFGGTSATSRLYGY